METIKKFLKSIVEFSKSETGKKIVYEVQSFALTFGAVLVGLVGVDKFTSLDVLITNRDIIVGAVGAAFSRTAIIYIMAFIGINYRDLTKKFN